MKRRRLKSSDPSSLAKLDMGCFDCAITVTQPKRPDLKGIVEKAFERFNHSFTPLLYINGREPQKRSRKGKE